LNLACVEGCSVTKSQRDLIQCSHCYFWYHLHCVGLQNARRSKWFCSKDCEEAGYRIVIPANKNFNGWTNEQLRSYLVYFDLAKSGTKEELVARLNKRESSGMDIWCKEPMKPFDFAFHGAQGPKNVPSELSPDSSLEWLHLFWDADVWDMMTHASNLYVPPAKKNKPGYVRWRSGKDVSVAELKTFFGLRLHMALFGVQVQDEQWEEKLVSGGHVIDMYRNIFTRERWLDIQRNLHVVQASAKSEEDKLWRLRPLITHLQEVFQHYWNPFKVLAIDEGSIPSKARLLFKQYNPKKPHKWFIKVFAMVDLATYLWAFHIYYGSHERPLPVRIRKSFVSMCALQPTVIIPPDQDETVVFQHVMKLVDQLPANRPFRLYFDNYYTALELLRTLKMLRLRATGTFNKKTSGFPNALKYAKLSKKGDVVWRTLGQEYGALKWKDTKGVLMASNFVDPSEMSTSMFIYNLLLFSVNNFFFFVCRNSTISCSSQEE